MTPPRRCPSVRDRLNKLPPYDPARNALEHRVSTLEAEVARLEGVIAGWQRSHDELGDAYENLWRTFLDLAISRQAPVIARRLRSEGRANRAQFLRAEEKLSVQAIGIRIAHDEGRDQPYPARTVNRWLAKQKPLTGRVKSVTRREPSD